MIAAAAFVWFCGSSGICVDLASMEVHYPSITTLARSTGTDRVFPIRVECKAQELFYLESGGKLASMPYVRGSLFDVLCHKTFGEEL